MHSLSAIVAAIKDGEVVAYPTEGVWGVGCDPSNEEALKMLINLKNRSKRKGFILVGSELFHFNKYAEVEVNKTRLLSKWPGPHTWLVPALEISPLLSGGKKTIALRLSEHKEVVAICNKFGGAIISTSANKEGDKTPLDPEGIQEIFPGIKVMKGELGGLNKPSTIEDLVTGEVIRS
jgi:L-threonylcarbamoyladenylate synthase